MGGSSSDGYARAQAEAAERQAKAAEARAAAADRRAQQMQQQMLASMAQQEKDRNAREAQMRQEEQRRAAAAEKRAQEMQQRFVDMLAQQNKERESVRRQQEEQFNRRIEEMKKNQELSETQHKQMLQAMRDDHEKQFSQMQDNHRKAQQAMQKSLDDQQKQHDEKLQFMEIGALKKEASDATAHLLSMEKPYRDLVGSVRAAARKFAVLQAQVDKEETHLKQRFKDEVDDADLLRIVLYGPTGHGKSTLTNRLCGDASEDADQGPCDVSGQPESETQGISKVVARGDHLPFAVSVTDQAGTGDTGWNDRMHANRMVQYLRGIGHLNAIVLVRKLQTPRIETSQQEMLLSLQEMLGRRVWKHTVIAMTGVDSEREMTQFRKRINPTRTFIRGKVLKISEEEAPFPVVPIANMGDWRQSVASLVRVCQTLGRFECEGLRSPLEALISQRDRARNELKALEEQHKIARQEAEKMEARIRRINDQIKKKDNGFEPLPLRSFLQSAEEDEGWEEDVKTSTPDEPAVWSCPCCALENEEADSECQMCGTARGTATLGAQATPAGASTRSAYSGSKCQWCQAPAQAGQQQCSLCFGPVS